MYRQNKTCSVPFSVNLSAFRSLLLFRSIFYHFFFIGWDGPLTVTSAPVFLSENFFLSISWISFSSRVSTVCAGCLTRECALDSQPFILSSHKTCESDIPICLLPRQNNVLLYHKALWIQFIIEGVVHLDPVKFIWAHLGVSFSLMLAGCHHWYLYSFFVQNYSFFAENYLDQISIQ